MLSKELYSEVLLKPAYNGAEHLYIISGYATSAMPFHHIQELLEHDIDINVDLIVGMTNIDGLSASNHKGFIHLVEKEFPNKFNCSYIYRGKPVHSKAYIWLKNKNPILSFTGSANYTQHAFYNKQREIMTQSDAEKAFKYYHNLIGDSIYCTNHEAELFLRIYEDIISNRLKPYVEEIEEVEGIDTKITGLDKVEISFLDRKGELPQRSGLNWGQRPNEGREPNQAYIKLPSKIYKTKYFPIRGMDFTVLTDDNKTLICKRAQDNAKAIHTPHNNSLLGIYFRNRIGVELGQPIKTEDLLNYGRTSVDFYKIDDETYYMDFSV